MEHELQLSVQKLELGTITTNAIAIRDKVKDMLVNYKAENYNEDNIEEATKDRALLNNTSKALDSERLRLEREFMNPFNNFKSVVAKTITMIKEASANIDEIVKEVENKAKEVKKSEIQKIFDEMIGKEAIASLINLEQIFDDKWLNKTVKIEAVEKEMFDTIRGIVNDLIAIENLKSEHELALKNQYLKSFNLGEVIIENNRLNELKISTQKVEVAKEEIREAKIEEMTKVAVQSESDDPIKTYTLEITGTLSQHKKLKEFLELNKMHTVNFETKKVIVN